MNEGYLPLYRKYRPQKLDDIVGQAHIKRALTNAIELNKISHAYLFTGPRGTGKTSTARILAKSLNCINGPTLTPCEECESCKAITNTVPIDVIELDAASNRSVDDARDILEKVNYAPVHGKYKIYIIDEVHMLTDAAFNTLLKTLEEPPKNVIFILATTEAHKVLDTIKSRCQRFDFKRITTNDIVEHLKNIAKAENIKISDGAISVIAKSSAGGMRDSLALLDQVSALGLSSEITEADINSLLGRLSFESLHEIATHIVNSDGASAISTLEKIYNDGNEPIQILTNLMMFFKNLLIYKTCDLKSSVELTGLTEDQLKSVNEIKEALEKHQIVFLINKTADYIKELKTTTNQQMWLEVSLIDLANLTDNTKLLDLESRISALEGGNTTVNQTPAHKPVINVQPQKQIEEPHIEAKPAEAKPVEEKFEEAVIENPVAVEEEVHPEPEHEQTESATQTPQNNIEKTDSVAVTSSSSDMKNVWIQILQTISSPATKAIFKQHGNPVKLDKDGVVIAFKSQPLVDNVNRAGNKTSFIEAVKSVFGVDSINVTFREILPDDTKIEKVYIPPKKSIAPNLDLSAGEEQISEQEKDTVAEQNKSKANTTNKLDTHSEQSSMVKELFDGKYLD